MSGVMAIRVRLLTDRLAVSAAPRAAAHGYSQRPQKGKGAPDSSSAPPRFEPPKLVAAVVAVAAVPVIRLARDTALEVEDLVLDAPRLERRNAKSRCTKDAAEDRIF